MKISKRTRSIIGIVAIVTVVALAVLWNTVLRQTLTSTQVLALKSPVFAGDKIEGSNLTYKTIARTDVIPGALKTLDDAKALTSYEARQYVPAGVQLVKEFFEKPELVLADGQFIFSVPSEWIAAVPSTIRRKDTAYFYALSGSDVERIAQFTQATVAPGVTPSAGSTIVVSGDSTNAPASTTTNGTAATAMPTPTPTPTATATATLSASTTLMPTATADTAESLLLKSLTEGRKYEITATIAYVRDKSNKEVVTSSKDITGKLERLDGSNGIDHLEIIATQEQIDKMQTAALKGFKFVVLYR
jgi:hypothetical protein